MKKKLLLIPFTIIASVAVFGPMASADTMQLTLDYGNRHSGVGGEFNASSADFAPAAMGYGAQTIYNSGHPNTGFETFCMEMNEHFNPGSTYYYGISQAATHGGVPGGSDPISIGTAWLYGLFATGNLPGYNYTGPNGNLSAGLLQDTIWWLEGEGADPGNQFSMLVTTQFGGDPMTAMADNNGTYGVGVLNLWADSNHTQFAQDQLILIPGPNLLTTVPDGGSTAMLLGLGFLGLFVGRWKLNRRSHAA